MFCYYHKVFDKKTTIIILVCNYCVNHSRMSGRLHIVTTATEVSFQHLPVCVMLSQKQLKAGVVMSRGISLPLVIFIALDYEYSPYDAVLQLLCKKHNKGSKINYW